MWVYRLPVHIGPTECTVFTENCGEFATSKRADVGIGPYSQTGKCNSNSPKRFCFRSCLLRADTVVRPYADLENSA